MKNFKKPSKYSDEGIIYTVSDKTYKCSHLNVHEENGSVWCKDCEDFVLCPYCGYFMEFTEDGELTCSKI